MQLPLGLQILLVLATCFYSVVVVGLLIGIRRLTFKPSASKPSASVIVAARNEAANIGNLLEHLVRQDYDDLEIIVVNDRSTDRTASIVERFQSEYPRVRLLNVVSVLPGMPYKKNALTQGIESSRGDILCFTDADCLPPPRWVSSLVAAFGDDVGLVAGYSPYSASPVNRVPASPLVRLLHEFIEYEEMKGAFWSAGSIGLNKAWLCTGRSLAYRRRVYDEVGKFDKIKQSISGDDDLFLQLVRRETAWRIRYVTSRESFVPTFPSPHLRDFVQQRTRHFSAGRFFPPAMKAFFFLFHMANFLISGAFLVSIFQGFPASLVIPYLCKCVVDSIVFLRMSFQFDQRRFVLTFVLMEMLYVLYNTLIGPLGFLGRFDWKPAESS